jgi:prepilin-type N-terminal cleavage/methylation domain-containing protein
VRAHPRRDGGFTLIEVLIVVIVVAILSMIVLPKLIGANRTAKEATLQADLRVLRQAVESFRLDTGGHPLLLQHLMSDEPPRFALTAPTGGLIRVAPGAFRGPYLVTGGGGLPVDPIAGHSWWRYDWRTGFVSSWAQGMALDGTVYADW